MGGSAGFTEDQASSEADMMLPQKAEEASGLEELLEEVQLLLLGWRRRFLIPSWTSGWSRGSVVLERRRVCVFSLQKKETLKLRCCGAALSSSGAETFPLCVCSD